MSIGSALSSLTGTSHAAFSTRSATSTASEELEKLFSKLHMDAVGTSATSASSTTSTDASMGANSTTGTSSGGAVTDIVHSLRHILDGGISVAKEARTAARTAASAYAHGGGIGALATQVVDKLA